MSVKETGNNSNAWHMSVKETGMTSNAWHISVKENRFHLEVRGRTKLIVAYGHKQMHIYLQSIYGMLI